MRIYISGLITEDAGILFDEAECLLKDLNHVPINPLKINSYQLAPWPVRLELLSSCEAIFLLNDFTQSKESIIEKYFSEVTGKEIMFQSLVEENISRECFERPLIARVTGAIQSVTGKKFDQYREENRKPEVFYPRIIFSHECNINGLPEERIAHYLGRDVTTIKHQLKKYDDNYGFVKEFRIDAEDVNLILTRENHSNISK